MTADVSFRTFRETFRGGVNVDHEVIYRNIRTNIARPLPQIDVHAPNDYEVAMLCGGPSLAQAEIPPGYKIATCNGTYDWALRRGLRPSVFMMLDARPHNVRFITEPLQSCRYFLCSQVDPSMFERLEGYDVRLFHGCAKPEREILDDWYMGRWRKVPGGGTVGLCALWILYLIGVRTARFYGLDGCLVDDQHHAYDQPENDGNAVFTVTVEGRSFRAHPWMLAQIDDFLQICSVFPDDMNVSFEGDTLIPHIVRETARLGRPPTIVME